MNYNQEKQLRDYMIGLYGVGQKLAHWSLTNVTGHWFVIDDHIAKAIDVNLRHTIPNIKITTQNADKIFSNWFGYFIEDRKCYSKLNEYEFLKLFPDYSENECEYLPFITTQHLWFYGKFVMNKKERPMSL